jgi:hypothetical protein
MSTVPPEQPPARKAPAAATPTAPPQAGEDLPWLAKTTTGPAPGKTDGADAKPPAAASAKPAPAKPAPEKKTAAKIPQKCEEQPEDGCRALTACAWVAAIPQVDGTLKPARCSDRALQAPAKKPKPTVAAKPKPKPADPAQVVAPPVAPAMAPAGDPPPPAKEAKADTPPAAAKTEPAPAAVPPVAPRAEAPEKPTPPAAAPLATPAPTPVAAPAQAPIEEKKTEADQPLSIPGLVIAE